MFCYIFVIIFKKVYSVFPTASFDYFIDIDIYALAILLEATRQLWGEKLAILFTVKKSLIHFVIVLVEASLNGLLRVIMSWSAVNPSCLFRLEVYSFRHAITHKVLSSHHIYSNLSRSLPFPECLSTSVCKKVTNKSFRTILLTLNNLIALSLWTPRSSSRTMSFCVKIVSDNKQLSPCCSKYQNKISTSYTKLSFGFGRLKLNMPVICQFITGCLFKES